jgi:23S rRNA pseudouridine1911/1915/1917 synthase
MIRVIYEDEAILVVEKPAGVQAQEAKGFGKDMVSEIKKYLAKKGCKDLYVGVVHRLDQPVKGVMVYGKTREATAALSKQMAEAGHMDKEYLALVCGKPPAKSVTLVDELYFDRNTNTTRVVQPGEKCPEAKRAELIMDGTEYMDGTVLERMVQEGGEETLASTYFENEIKRLLAGGMIVPSEHYALVRVMLLTGRHHQLRVQLAHAGFPILGDVRYNLQMTDYKGLSALCLCARRIAFHHPVTGKTMEFSL